MPQLLTGLVFTLLTSNALTFGLAGSAFIISGLSNLLFAGLVFGAQLLLAPRQPKPDDVQQSFRQPTPRRTALYGKGKLAGPWVFAAARAGVFHKVIALSSRPLTTIESYWIDDNEVTLNGSGWATSGKYVVGYGNNSAARIQTRLGAATETYYSDLETSIAEWTSDHRGDGVASLYLTLQGLKAEDVAKIFPNGINTTPRVVAEGVAVYDPTDGGQAIGTPAGWAYTDTLACVVMDYLWHQDGMRLPVSLVSTAQALAGWQQAVNDCRDAITLKAGGTEDRYRCWGAYGYDERPADVLRRFLAAGDARLKPTPDGGLTLEVGKWAAPTVTLDEEAIVYWQDVRRGRSILETANTIYSQFTSPDHDFQATDADAWIDDDDVSERGEIPASPDFMCAPSHGQCRRLMKIAAHRANPEWVGTFICNLRGLAAFEERFINIDFPTLGIDGTFEIVKFDFIFGEGSILQAVAISVQSMTSAAYAWDAASEEGTAPAIDRITATETEIPVPTGLDVVVTRITVGGLLYPAAELSWDAPPSPTLTVEAQHKIDSSDAWLPVAVNNDETEAQTGILLDGGDYEFRIRFVSTTGRTGDWTDVFELAVVADPTAPGDLTNVSVTGDLGHADISLKAPTDDNFRRVAVYRNQTGSLDADNDLVGYIYLNPGATVAYVDGDGSIVNLLSNPGFDSDTVWTKGAGWSIAAGKATKAAGSSSSLGQSQTLDVGVAYRFGGTVSGYSAGNLWFGFKGGTQVLSSLISANGQHVRTVSTVSGNNEVIALAGSTFAGSLDDLIVFKETAECAPQGTNYYWLAPQNYSGVEGTVSGPHSVTIV